MTRAEAHIGQVHYRVAIRAGGHDLIADEPVAVGGGDAGPAPHELLLAALGACTAITVRMYADRKAWPLTALDVSLELTREAGRERIERVLTFEGPLDDLQRARLIEIAEHCPVHQTLQHGVTIATHEAGRPTTASDH